MDTIQLTRLLNNIPVKGEVCAKDQLPEKKSLETKAYIVNTDLSEDPGEHWVVVYFRGNRAIYFDSYGMSPDQDFILPFIKRNSTGWIRNTEMLQSPLSKLCGMWCIYIIHQLNRGLDLKSAIHQELKGTGKDLYQNDRDIDMWFSLNYGRVILSKEGMMRMAPPDFLFKHRIQNCKCLHKTHCLSNKYPMYKLL